MRICFSLSARSAGRVDAEGGRVGSLSVAAIPNHSRGETPPASHALGTLPALTREEGV